MPSSLFSLLFVAFAVFVAADPCTDDLDHAVKLGEDVVVTIRNAIRDCALNSTGCAEDITKALNDLTSIADDINKAVKDCGGISNACSHDITGLLKSLTTATNDIAKAVADCPVNKDKCIADVLGAVGSLGGVLDDIRKAVADCKAPQVQLVQLGGSCGQDVNQAVQSAGTAFGEIKNAFGLCARGNFAACQLNLTRADYAMSKAYDGARRALGGDCAGNFTGNCTAALHAIQDAATLTFQSISLAILDCTAWQDPCTTDVTNSLTYAAAAVNAAKNATGACKPAP